MKRLICYIVVAILFVSTNSACHNYALQSVKENNTNVTNPYTSSCNDTALTELTKPETNDIKSESQVSNSILMESNYETSQNCSLGSDQNDKLIEKISMVGDGYKILTVNEYVPETNFDLVLPRVEEISIYKMDSNYPESSDEYDYSIVAFYGEDKSILCDIIYLSNTSFNYIGGMIFVEELSPYVSYHQYNAIIPYEEFELLMKSPKDFFENTYVPSMHYIETINLETIFNKKCKKKYLMNIKVDDNMSEVDLYLLDNDAFGKKYMLSNGRNSFFTDDFQIINIYERNSYENSSRTKYNLVQNEFKDYLLELKQNNNNRNECIYLGTNEDQYMFSYNYSVNGGFYNIGIEDLSEDGWNLIKSIAI